MSLMRQEMQEQPEAVCRVLERETDAVRALAQMLRERAVRHVVIAARGTSDNAATYAKYLLEIVAGVPVSLAAPSVYTLYDGKPDLRGALALGISQSGQAPDVVQTLAAARAAGALTACITNVPETPITRISDCTLLCHAGEERSVAATKSYTTALALVALLTTEWAEDRRLGELLRRIPDQVAEALALEDSIAAAVERYRFMEECAVLARGVNLPTALETALKMTETSYVVAKPYSAADFLHGPIAMADEDLPCLLFAPDGRTFETVCGVADRLRERQSETVIFARAPEILDRATRAIAVPVEVDELLSPLIYAVPGQLWAYHLARTRGRDPDSPRGLTKVTRTR